MSGRRKQAFELLGCAEDETRLVRAPLCGYSIALAGHPRVETAPEGRAAYDIVVALHDIPIHHGFRIDEISAQREPQTLALEFVAAYRNQRAKQLNATVKPLPIRPDWLLGGAHVIYALRDQPEPTMEQVWVTLRSSPAGFWVLFHTTWFKTSDVDQLRWSHVRASFIDQHAWDGTLRETVPNIWPQSTITLPLAKLDLTESAWEAAGVKAADLGPLTTEQETSLIDAGRTFAASDLSPRTHIPDSVRDIVRTRVMQAAPSEAAAVLLGDLDSCTTRHDFARVDPAVYLGDRQPWPFGGDRGDRTGVSWGGTKASPDLGLTLEQRQRPTPETTCPISHRSIEPDAGDRDCGWRSAR